MFSSLLNKFSNNLDTLRDFVDLVSPILEKAHLEEIKNNPSAFIPLILAMNALEPELFDLDSSFAETIESKFDGKIDLQIKDEENKKTVNIKLEGSGKEIFYSSLEKFAKRYNQKGLLYQNALISLVSAVEWFLSQLLHQYFEMHPEAAGIRDRSLTLSELQSIGTIDEAKSYLIDLRIEEVLRGSFSDWVNFLKTQLKLSMGYLSDDENYLIEICQRRNLLVHNGGIVNKIYLAKVSDSMRQKLEIGKPISVSQEYLDESITRFERFFFLACLELWKKLLPHDGERARILNDLTYKNLCNERWKIAESLSYFLMQDKQLPEIDRLVGQINYWQSLKWQNIFEGIRKDVETADFSAKDERFLLAKAALLDDEKLFFELLPVALKTDKLNENDLRSWPLFQKIRKGDAFKRLYEPARLIEDSSSNRALE
jgi:hypothetical protein